MNKLVFPALLVATIMVAGAFAFMPVEQATTVHNSGGVTAATLVGGSEEITTTAATAISLTTTATNWETTGAATATLADGGDGQIKVLCVTTFGGNQVVTPATFTDGTDLTFDAVNECVTLIFYQSQGWAVIENTGGVVVE